MENKLSRVEFGLFYVCILCGLSVGPISIFTPLKEEAYIWFGSLPAIISFIIGKGWQATAGYTRSGRYYRKEYKGDLYFYGGIIIGGVSLLFFMLLKWIYSKMFLIS